jgi:hypothetical protein
MNATSGRDTSGPYEVIYGNILKEMSVITGDWQSRHVIARDKKLFQAELPCKFRRKCRYLGISRMIRALSEVISNQMKRVLDKQKYVCYNSSNLDTSLLNPGCATCIPIARSISTNEM